MIGLPARSPCRPHSRGCLTTTGPRHLHTLEVAVSVSKWGALRQVPRSCGWLRPWDWRTAGRVRLPCITFLARCASPSWPCSLLQRFRDSAPLASLSPNSRATPLPSEVRQQCVQIRQDFGLPQLASYLANRQERCGARQCFWAYIA
jgi:hypothetical protein